MLNQEVEKETASDPCSNTRTPLRGRVVDDPLALLEVVASPSRQRILALLMKGVDHPEDLARRLKLRRQSVDKQLLELYKWGFVDRSAILPASGRPRIVYRLSERGRDFLAHADALVREYGDGIHADFQRGLNLLEDKLASGELDEDAYLRKRMELEARYAHFRGEPPKQ